MAVLQILAIYELLENILLHLPLRQLLLAQCVSTAFRDLILRSGRINRALFFGPATTEMIEWYPAPEFAGHTRERQYQGEWKVEADGGTVSPVLNPFLPVVRSTCGDTLTEDWDPYLGVSCWDMEEVRHLFNRGENLAFMTPPQRSMCDYWTDKHESKMLHGEEVFAYAFLIRQWNELAASSKRLFQEYACDASIKPGQQGSPPTVVFLCPPGLSLETLSARFGSFIVAAAEVSSTQRLYTKENFVNRDDTNSVEIVGGELWQPCPKSVNEITGWEMLPLLGDVN